MLRCGLFFSLAIAAIVSPSTADDEDKIFEPTETAPFVIQVTDENGKPIEGVTLRPYACRCVEDRGSHYGWPTYNVGKPVPVETDKEGRATIDYPLRFGRDPDWKTTCEISASATHAEFISDVLNIDPRPGNGTMTMRQGCQLRISVADTEGERTPFGIVMAGPGGMAKWKTDPSGMRLSRAIPDGSWQTLLVSPREDGRHLFSGVLPIRLRDNQDVNIRNLRLKPGIRIAGRLDDSVPRPVKNGKILAHCLPRPAGFCYADEDPSVSWEDAASINEDGTFEFPSLPRSGMIQLITVCDTHIGKDVDPPDPNQNAFTQGMYLQVDERDDLENLTIPMEATGTVRVKVLDPDGNPLVGAKVGTWPNQSMHLAGSNVLGEYSQSIELIRQQIQSDSTPSWERRNYDRYSRTTDENGEATLISMPIGTGDQIAVHHDDYLMPQSGFGDRREVNVNLEDSTPVEVTVKMQSLESAKLDKGIGEAKKALDNAAEAIKRALGNGQ